MVYRAYFQNRLAEIHDNVKELKDMVKQVDEIRHIPGKDNPADELTRGACNTAVLSSDSEWLQGPPFLSFSPDKWPLTSKTYEEVPSVELKATASCAQDVLIHQVIEKISTLMVEK